MKKNVGSQSVGAQMITAADGTDFTGAVTVVVTIDNGTQSASGGTAPAHEGNGYHSYTPTQAETNGDHVAFTFTGSGAISTTVQVYTTFPQTGDSFALIGANGAGLTDLATAAEMAKVPKSDGASSWNATALAAINAEADTAIADASLATAAELVKVPKSDGTATWNATALASINAEADTAISDAALATAASIAALNDVAATDIVSAGAITTSAGAVSNVTLVATTTTNTDMLTAAAVNAEVDTALATTTYAEPSGVPAATASLKDKIGWLAALARNKLTQTATTQTLRNDADGADIAASTVSDDGTTATRGEFV